MDSLVEQSEKKVYVIHENSDWLPDLRASFTKIDCPFEEIHLGKGGAIDMSEKPKPGVYYSRMSASSHSRGHRYAPEFCHALLEWLELNNARLINGTIALSYEISKVRQYAALLSHNIKTPKTVVVTGDEDMIIEQAKLHFQGQQFITKHNRAGKGLGVHLFKNVDALTNYVKSDEFEFPIDGITLLQQYIKNPDQVIIRAEFINSQFMYAVQVSTADGFELCPNQNVCQLDQHCPVIHKNNNDEDEILKKKNQSTKFTILKDFDHPIISQIEKLLQDLNIEIAGVEFIADDNEELYVYDINTNTNYNDVAEYRAFDGLRGMPEIASFLSNELNKINSD